MVNVTKGVLIECDPAMKQFLLHLDEKNEFGRKFVLQIKHHIAYQIKEGILQNVEIIFVCHKITEDLDDTHIFVASDIIETLQERIDELMDQMSFNIAEK